MEYSKVELLKKINDEMTVKGILKQKDDEIKVLEKLHDLEHDIMNLESSIKQAKTNEKTKLFIEFGKNYEMGRTSGIALTFNEEIIFKICDNALQIMKLEYNKGIQELRKNGVKIVDKFEYERLAVELNTLEKEMEHYLHTDTQMARMCNEQIEKVLEKIQKLGDVENEGV